MDMKDVPKNMRRIGMRLFQSAFIEAVQGHTPMCVVHAAHAAEILLKARIAQEHPLLIFSKLPKSDPNKENLTLIDLLEGGRTLSYEELPDQLWATTGIKINQISQYKEFGRLRNQIVHFSMATAKKLDKLTLNYSLELLDPLVESFWGKSVIEFIARDPSTSSYISSGELEAQILGDSNDQRLRRLLGNGSKKAYERIKEELEKSKTEFEYINSLDANDMEHIFPDTNTMYYDDYDQSIANKNWENFLDSF
jgi:HEPN domain-containing protein